MNGICVNVRSVSVATVSGLVDDDSLRYYGGAIGWSGGHEGRVRFRRR